MPKCASPSLGVFESAAPLSLVRSVGRCAAQSGETIQAGGALLASYAGSTGSPATAKFMCLVRCVLPEFRVRCCTDCCQESLGPEVPFTLVPNAIEGAPAVAAILCPTPRRFLVMVRMAGSLFPNALVRLSRQHVPAFLPGAKSTPNCSPTVRC